MTTKFQERVRSRSDAIKGSRNISNQIQPVNSMEKLSPIQLSGKITISQGVNQKNIDQIKQINSKMNSNLSPTYYKQQQSIFGNNVQHNDQFQQAQQVGSISCIPPNPYGANPYKANPYSPQINPQNPQTIFQSQISQDINDCHSSQIQEKQLNLINKQKAFNTPQIIPNKKENTNNQNQQYHQYSQVQQTHQSQFTQGNFYMVPEFQNALGSMQKTIEQQNQQIKDLQSLTQSLQMQSTSQFSGNQNNQNQNPLMNSLNSQDLYINLQSDNQVLYQSQKEINIQNQMKLMKPQQQQHNQNNQMQNTRYSQSYISTKNQNDCNAPKVKYKQYTLQEYKNLSPNGKLGGLGPFNIGTEAWQKAKVAQKKQIDYAKNVRQINSAIVSSTQGKKKREEKAHNSRNKALTYAANVPKPRVRTVPQTIIQNQQPKGDKISEIDRLEMQREAYRDQIESIRSKVNKIQ